MQNFSLYMVQFSTDPFVSQPDLKIADGSVADDGTCQLTFLSQFVGAPQTYRSLDELKQVHCGDGSKLKLVFAP